MRSSASAFVRIPFIGLAILSVGGCPTGTTTTGGTTQTGGTTATETQLTVQSGLTVTESDIPVRFDSSIKLGDDLIVFGTGNLTGVAYIVPSTAPTAATPIPGEFRNVGFAVAGKKVLLFDDQFQLTVYDTETETATAIETETVLLATLPTHEDQEIYSPVVASGTLALTLNRKDEVTDGHVLKLIDLSGAEPVVTSLIDPPTGVAQIAIDGDEQIAVVQGVDHFFVYDLSDPAAGPRDIDLSAGLGILGPFVYDAGRILYVVSDVEENIRLLDVETGTVSAPTLNPGNRDLPLALRAGTLAYFLNRVPNDTYATIYRGAVATDAGAVEGGTAGADPDDSTHPWFGYGSDVAITPSGGRIFISGNEAVDTATDYLQVSTGGAFQVFAAGSGFLNATDVEASATLVAFKTGADEDTTLAYIVLP
jgi:hypothetical protein